VSQSRNSPINLHLDREVSSPPFLAENPGFQPIEITFGRPTDRRRVATRYDRWPAVFFSAIALAAIVIFWL
jgi:hypothetical protein